MITKESIVLSIRVNNYETEILNKYKDTLTLQYQENEKHLNHIWAECSTLDYTSKSNESPINPPINVKLTILGALEEIDTSDLNVNVEKREFIIKYKNQAANHLPFARNQAERWKPVLLVFEERLKFIQSRLDDLKKQNINLKRALLDLEEGKSIEEVVRILLESQKNKKDDEKKEYDAKLKELGYENLEQLCDAIATKMGNVKGERISDSEIEKVYSEITELGIKSTIKSVTTTLRDRKKCGYSKSRKKETPEIK